MPVPAQIGLVNRNDDEMPDAWIDPGLAPGAHVGFASLIGLDRVDGFVIAERVVVVGAGIHGMKSIP